MSALGRLAHAAGIEARYVSYRGEEVRAQPATQRALLGALGFEAQTDAGAQAALLRSRAPPARGVTARSSSLPKDRRPYFRRGTRSYCEDGSLYAGSLDALPLGYHRAAAGGRECRLIVAPERCYLPPAMRDRGIWAVATQLYALRSERNWGIGDFGDLQAFGEMASRAGARRDRAQSASRTASERSRRREPVRAVQPSLPERSLHRRRAGGTPLRVYGDRTPRLRARIRPASGRAARRPARRVCGRGRAQTRRAGSNAPGDARARLAPSWLGRLPPLRSPQRSPARTPRDLRGPRRALPHERPARLAALAVRLRLAGRLGGRSVRARTRRARGFPSFPAVARARTTR